MPPLQGPRITQVSFRHRELLQEDLSSPCIPQVQPNGAERSYPPCRMGQGRVRKVPPRASPDSTVRPSRIRSPAAQIASLSPFPILDMSITSIRTRPGTNGTRIGTQSPRISNPALPGSATAFLSTAQSPATAAAQASSA
jgi:hypothetical protein